MSIYTGIVKPHYRLLGMLLERHELHTELTARLEAHASGTAKKDPKVRELRRQIASLDKEIRGHQSQVWERFRDEGRSMNDLKAFIGEDLMAELAATGVEKVS